MKIDFPDDYFMVIQIDINPKTGDGSAYFTESDVNADIMNWEFTHPNYGTQFRLLYRAERPLDGITLQRLDWKTVFTAKFI